MIEYNSYNDRTVEYLKQSLGERVNTKKTIFNESSVCIVVGEDATNSFSGQMLASFIVNLALRLHPVIKKVHVCILSDINMQFTTPKWSENTFILHLQKMADDRDPDMQFSISQEFSTHDTYIVLGHPDNLPKTFIGVTSNGWVAFLAKNECLKVSSNINPVGAYAAACFAVTEIWNQLINLNLNPVTPYSLLKENNKFVFNTFVYSTDTTNNPIFSQVKIEDISIIGVGAGGGATLFTLASLSNISGGLFVVDKEKISKTNINRYVYALKSDIGKEKVEIARHLFDQHKSFFVNYESSSFQDLSNSKKDNLSKVCCMVDNTETKRLVNTKLPFLIWDAAAENGVFRISRQILGVTECLHCKHPEDEVGRKAYSNQYSQITGLSPKRILELDTSSQFTKKDTGEMLQHKVKHVKKFQLPNVGDSWSDWTKSNCGQINFDIIDDNTDLPMPIAPILAGVLIAGEIIKEECFPNAVLNSRYDGDILVMNSGPNSVPQYRKPKPRCVLCRDEDFLQAYKRKWLCKI